MTSEQKEKESRSMEKEWQSNAEYKRLSIQRTTGEKISRLIYGFIYHWRSGFY